MKKRLLALILASTMVLGCLNGCGAKQEETATEAVTTQEATEAASEEATTSEATEEAEAASVNVMYSKGFTIELLEDGIKKVTDGDNRELILVPKALGEIPAEYADSIVITTPVENAVFLSSTQVCTFNLIKDEAVLAGIGGVQGDAASWEGIPEIQKRVESGDIVDVGGNGMGEPDYEVLQSINPDVVFLYKGTNGDPTVLAKLDELGINYAVDNDYMESNYLARMEWMRFLLTFFDADAAIDEAMNQAAANVEEVKAQVAGLEQPKIAVFSVYDGSVYATADDSWVGSMIADMGGVNAFSELGEKTITMEEAFDCIKEADVIIYTSTAAYCNGMEGIQEAFPQITECTAYENGRVYQYDENFWIGIDKSDVMAADLAATLYPEVFADRELTFYIQLNK